MLKITRLNVLIALLACGIAVATTITGDYADVRPAGSSTISGSIIYQVCDSSDTFQVDTFYSDTVIIDTSSSWINYGFTLVAKSLADSTNDSVVIIVETYTAYDRSTAKRKVDVDTFAHGATGPPAGDTLWNHTHLDSLVFTRLWFQTIVKDSFKMGAGMDTSSLTLVYQTLQKD